MLGAQQRYAVVPVVATMHCHSKGGAECINVTSLMHGQYNTRRWIGNELIYGGICGRRVMYPCNGQRDA